MAPSSSALPCALPCLSHGRLRKAVGWGWGWGSLDGLGLACLGSRKDVLSYGVPVPTLSRRLAGAGGRKKIFRLSDVLKPLTDAQVEAMKLGAVKRILRAEKAVACSGAAQVCPASPAHASRPSPHEPASQPREEVAPGSNLPGSRSQLGCPPALHASLLSSFKWRW